MIKEVDFQSTMENAFLAYSASVAQERAIPDVRDMLKIGLRQGLYAQYTNKLTHKDKFQKAQKSVAAAMTQSYVHGDVAMYDTFIRAARPWSYRYPLEDVQGNFGNPTSPDTHAAARYVEMKAAEISNVLFDGLKKDAIGDEYYSNYDDTEMIPSVFPSIGFWNIVNGCSGIAVALATSVPTFNLTEVNNALITLIKNPNASFDEIYCAPDFPCGGTITNAAAVKESLKNGKGESARMRATLTYSAAQNVICATELPYGVYTNTIIDQLAALTTDNENYGIERVVDYTKKSADIRIYLSKGVNPKKMIDKLYKDTSLEYWYSINMTLLDQGRFPKIFGWREACEAYITHIRACKRRTIEYDLDKALLRKNIVDGLIKAYSIIDEIIALIKASNSPSAANLKLRNTYDFNEPQAEAILAMKLSSLTKLDIVKLTNEAEELVNKIEQYRYLLNNPSALDEELIKALQNVIEHFGDDRRTRCLNLTIEDIEEEQLKEEKVKLFVDDKNIFLTLDPTPKKVKVPKNSRVIYTTSFGTLAIITSAGLMYNLHLSDIEYNTSYSLSSLLNLGNEKILLVEDLSSFNLYKYLVTVSKHGFIKKSLISDCVSKLKRGVAIVKLEEKDELVAALASNEDDKVFIYSTANTYNYYSIKEISPTGRATKGVKGIKADEVLGAFLTQSLTKYNSFLTIAADGCGKLTPVEEYTFTSRGVKGNQVMDVQDSKLWQVIPIYDGITDIYNNISLESIPTQARVTAGTKLFENMR